MIKRHLLHARLCGAQFQFGHEKERLSTCAKVSTPKFIVSSHCILIRIFFSQFFLSPCRPLVAVANPAALHTKLQTLCRLAAGLEEDRVAVGVAGELLHGRPGQRAAAAGAGAAAAGAEAEPARRAGLQQGQQQHGALAGEAGQQQVSARV